MKVLITGQSGSGKTTLLKELGRRGLTTHNTDDTPGLARLEIRATGKPTDWPSGKIDWSQYAWNWQDKAIRALLNTQEDIFVGAVMSNQEKYYELFDHIFVLVVDDEELFKRRITRVEQRSNDDEENVRQSVANNKRNTEKFISAGAIPLNNHRPVSEVADELLRKVGL